MTYAKPPILGGSAKSDYENYLRTDELLNLQKGPTEWHHRDELLFTVVHQSSELWLKLASSEVIEATEQLSRGNLREPRRLLSRTTLCIQQMYLALEMLEKMSPADYQLVRQALGHGSGFDSPGFNKLRKSIPFLGKEFFRILENQRLSLIDIIQNDRVHEDLFQLAECLIELDEKLMLWRIRHLKVVERLIGASVNGTQGTPVGYLREISEFSFFPDLWEARVEMTQTSE